MTTAPSLPSCQTIICEASDGSLRISRDAPLPTLRTNELLIRVEAVALNPCDYKMHERFPCTGAIDGCDFAGVVVALGPGLNATCATASTRKRGAVVDRRFALGDRVCGAVHGSNPIRPDSGSFAEYIASEAEFTLRIADATMGFEEAAALGGTGIATLGMALFNERDGLGLEGMPEEPAGRQETVLVHGGSSSVGTMAMQLLRLTGHKPIATCSPKNYDLVRAYGAEEVFDYNSPECARDIKAYTRNYLRHVLDPFTDAKSTVLCLSAMSRIGGRYACLEMYPDYMLERKTVKVGFVMGPALLGHRLALDCGYERPEDLEMRAFGVRWYNSIQWLLDQGKLKPHPIKLLPGRFEAILKGIEALKAKTVSGQKMVVRITAAA